MSWPQQLHMQKHIAFGYPCPQIIAPKSHLHLKKGARTISHKIRTLTLKQGHDLQVEIPFTIEMK